MEYCKGHIVSLFLIFLLLHSTLNINADPNVEG